MFKRIKLISVFIFMVMILTAYGCSTAGKNTGTPQTIKGQRVGTTTNLRENTQPQAAAAIVTPPTQLLSLEKDSLRIISYIRSKNWKETEKRISTMKAEMKTLNIKLPKAGVPGDTMNNLNSSIDKLDVSIRAKSTYDAESYANDITRYIADATGSYTVLVPPDVMRLDYNLRQIEFNLNKKDFTLVQDNMENIKSLWETLRTQIISTDKNIVKMDNEIIILEADINKKNNRVILRDVKKAMNISASIKRNFEKTGRKP